MSYPNVIYGREGDQFLNSATKTKPFGTIMVFQDGREFVYSRVGGSDIATGVCCQEPAVVSTDDIELVVPADEAVAQTKVTLTMQTVLAANYYREGYLHVEDGTGQGHCFQIKSHPAESTGTGSCEFTLEENSGLLVAWVAGTTTCGLRKHPNDSVVIAPIDGSATGCVVGATVRAVTKEYYCWLQTDGMASVLTQGVVLLGQKVVRSDSTPGAVAPFTTTGDDRQIIGTVSVVAASTDYSLINLSIK